MSLLAQIKERRLKARHRESLLESLVEMLNVDTRRVIDHAQSKMEAYALENDMPDISESSYAQVHRNKSIQNPFKVLSKLSTETLQLLRDNFDLDSSGINRLMREAGDEGDVFYRERLSYPVKTSLLDIEVKEVYEIARDSLSIEDLTTIPNEKNDGVISVLTVTSYCIDINPDSNWSASNSYRMTPRLAGIIMELPERTDDVINYILERRSDATIDTDHLYEFLTTKSKALNDGVL